MTEDAGLQEERREEERRQFNARIRALEAALVRVQAVVSTWQAAAIDTKARGYEETALTYDRCVDDLEEALGASRLTDAVAAQQAHTGSNDQSSGK